MTKDAEHPLTELISIAAKAGIGLLPGGGLLTAGYEGLQLLSNQAAAQMERRSEKRYQEFIQSVFAGEVTPEVTEHLTADDYTALLSGCMADMENEKAKFYGRLAAAIGRGEVQGKSKRFLIITLSQVSDEQLQMLRRSYVATRFDLKPSQGDGHVDPVEILHLSHLVQKHEYDELVSRLMYVDKKLTELAEGLIQACFTTEELIPSAIGYVAWFPKLVDIIFDTNQFTLVESLINGFRLEAIRRSNRSIAVIDCPVLANFASPRVMVVGSEAAPESQAVVGSPAYFELRPKPVTPHDLTAHVGINLRLPTSGGLWSWPFVKGGRDVRVRAEGQMVCNTVPMMLDFALAGVGLAHLPEDVVQQQVQDGRLIRVLEDWCPVVTGYHLYYPSRRQPKPAFKLLLELLRANV